MAYRFFDADSSILTAASSVVAGDHRPIVQIGSALSAIPTTVSGSPSISGAVTVIGNPSISGQVGASVIGLTPVAVTNTPSISGTVNIGGTPNVNTAGSVVAFQGGAWTQSVVGNVGLTGTVITSLVSTVPSSVIVGASIFGLAPVNVTNTVTINPPSVSGTVGASVIGTVPITQSGTIITSLVSTVPSSVIVGASIFGLAPVNITNTNINVSGSVVGFQGGTQITSIVSTVPSSVLVGASVFGTAPVTQSGAWSASIITTIAPTTTVTSIASSTSNTQLLASNTARKGATIMNVAATSIMVKLGTTAAVTDYSVLMQDTDYYEVPALYSGRIDAISSSTAGLIRLTEITG